MKMHQLIRKAQRGDGDAFGFTQYTTWMWLVLLWGTVFAMVGFWRIGANFANDVTVRSGATAINTGDAAAAQTSLFVGYLGNDDTVDATASTFDTNAAERTVDGGIAASTEIAGEWAIEVGSTVRMERFYPGPAKCANAGDRTTCNE